MTNEPFQQQVGWWPQISRRVPEQQNQGIREKIEDASAANDDAPKEVPKIVNSEG